MPHIKFIKPGNKESILPPGYVTSCFGLYGDISLWRACIYKICSVEFIQSYVRSLWQAQILKNFISVSLPLFFQSSKPSTDCLNNNK